MIESNDVISLYENVACITDKMLCAAQLRDWEALSELESDCSREVEKIQSSDSISLLTPELRQKKIRVIQHILANDRQIRDITEPWMAELQQLMRSSSTSMKLNKTYAV
ncbi:flagellar protein FliT [Undibacterium luofuense]|uniref:flagellar protein FliT n=1 Tax=Undibacterium luofuense TaxID=2828733 RepID=UPI001E52F3A7|nr:flagellar protein FliT [Undibacterium luofuense]